MVNLPEELLKNYGYNVEQKPEDIDKTAQNNLKILREQAIKIVETYNDYSTCEVDRMKDSLAEGMNSRLNHIVQAFKEIMSYIKILQDGFVEGESLRYYVRAYESLDGVKKDGDIREVLRFMQKRNELVHDYFSIDRLNYELVGHIASYGKGYKELAEEIDVYCRKNIPELDLQKNIKKEIKNRAAKKMR